MNMLAAEVVVLATEVRAVLYVHSRRSCAEKSHEMEHWVQMRSGGHCRHVDAVSQQTPA